MDEEKKMREDSHAVICNIRRLRLALTHGLNKRLASSGINVAQFGAMAVIEQKDAPTMGNLTDELGTTMGAVTSLIDRLVYAGYVERQRNETDRRVVRVTLTPEGQKVLTHHLTWGSEKIIRFFKTVSPDELKTFIEVFERLVDSIENNLADL